MDILHLDNNAAIVVPQTPGKQGRRFGLGFGRDTRRDFVSFAPVPIVDGGEGEVHVDL